MSFEHTSKTSMVPASLALKLIKSWEDRYNNTVTQVKMALEDLELDDIVVAKERLQGILDQDTQMYDDWVNNLNKAFIDAGLEPLEM